MQIRKLELKDAPFMLEWICDKNVISGLQKEKFANMDILKCEDFIKSSLIDEQNCHMAIVNEDDEYLGTVSLKNIDNLEKSAEFAIVLRTKAMGTGIGKDAMAAIIQYGFCVLNLKEIYWNVKIENKRAIRFYDKNGYERMQNVSENKLKNYIEIINNGTNFYWYHITN